MSNISGMRVKCAQPTTNETILQMQIVPAEEKAIFFFFTTGVRIWKCCSDFNVTFAVSGELGH